MGGEGGHNTKDIDSPSMCKNDGDENSTTTTRIFVGGLGATVTAEDLRNTFSCLGKYNGCMWKGGRLKLEKAKVHYRLRLRQEWAEDAKFANSAPCNARTKDMGSPEKLNNVINPEMKEVRIFFPKLKKVKSLPFSGSGKHKYSFQRLELPSLPIHFCDCEEHSDPSHTAKGKDFLDLETQVGGIDEKELDMMKSVMNKLFEREYISKTACSRDGLVEEEDDTAKSVDDLLADENETDHMTDEDNLVINVVAEGKNSIALSGSRGQEIILENERAVVDELRTSKERPSRNMLKCQGKIVPSGKKRKSPVTEETDGNEILCAKHERKGSEKNAHLLESARAILLESGIQKTDTNRSWLQKSTWRELTGERGTSSFSISHITQSTALSKEESKSDGVNVPCLTECQKHNLLDSINLESQPGCFKEPKEDAVPQPNKLNVASNKSARGASWLQKSSWTQLVGDTNNAFSISQILPRMDLEKQEAAGPKNMGAEDSTFSKYSKLLKSDDIISTEDGSKALGVGNGDIFIAADSSNTFAFATARDPVQSPSQINLPKLGETDEFTVAKKNHAAAEQPSVRNFTIAETCSFMRSAASMKEWMNAKTSLSGSLKKKNSEK
ncbi:RNA-binding (RRM/RBD/RNP motifs) family protein [Actinidia rufa]|uniref:RNA-binding (RRM/RBD/RNP motifs) family protein n=1 Tax=Actinidia rufa TaxID=165716 RepID=A0A7J0DMC7_9ERIC|nr:RNA-binding (RRM/RBD/RNP motifs) family protein [Actinidia rufa]